jgi:hypothetical protein
MSPVSISAPRRKRRSAPLRARTLGNSRGRFKKDLTSFPMLIRTIVCCACLAASSLLAAGELTSEVQQLQQQRTQQQLELQLKMQQQQDRAARPATAPFDLQRRQLERDQLQRQQQAHEQDSRSARAAPGEDTASSARLELERERAQREGVEQLQRFERERRIESDRAVPAASAPRRTTME